MFIPCRHSPPEAKNFEQVLLLIVFSHDIPTLLSASRRLLVVICNKLETNFVFQATATFLH